MLRRKIPKFEILRMGHPALRKVSNSIPSEEILSKHTQEFFERLYVTMKGEHNGIGIAAPQVNVSKQIIIVEFLPSTEQSNIKPLPKKIICNPQIQFHGSEKIYMWESCLSVPLLVGRVRRFNHISINFLDESARKRSIRASGYLAALLQHECDHLQGILFPQRLSSDEIKRTLVYEHEYEKYLSEDPSLQTCNEGDWSYLD